MLKPQNRCGSRQLTRPSLLGLVFSFVFAVSPAVQATITWSGGTNTVPADTTQPDSSIVITGGTNTVQGLAGPPAGVTSGGTLRLSAGGGGLQITGASVTLNSDTTSAGRLLLQGNVSTSASSTTALIGSGGAAANAGSVDLSSGTRILTIAPGTVPAAGADLSIAAKITNGGLQKAGTGILALSGTNNYAGGTRIDAGTLYINSAMAIGTADLTIAGPNTTIDNKSGGALTLPNNSVNILGGDLTFTGSSDLNFGTGFSIIANASSRAINIVNPNATLTLGGTIGDNGQHVQLIKTGTGTLALGGASLYTGGTAVNDGTLHLLNGAETGNGAVTVSHTATFIVDGKVNGNVAVSGVLGGAGTIDGALTVNSDGVVVLTGGTMTVNGPVTNNGLFVLGNGAVVAGNNSFVNNGTLDLTTAGGSVPPNLTNNGVIIDSSVVATKTVARAGNNLTVTIDSYTGHTYRLQKSSTPDAAGFTTNVGPLQNGSTGTPLNFTDASATTAPSFYRIIVDP